MEEKGDISNTSDIKSLFSSISSSPTIASIKLEVVVICHGMPQLSYDLSVGEIMMITLVKNANEIVTTERTKWNNTAMYSFLWNSLDPKLIDLFQFCKTCCKV